MAFTETEDLEEEQEEQNSNGSSNRNFWIIFGVLGGILLLALICMAIYAVFILPVRHEQTRNENATAIALNTQQVVSADQTEAASRITPTRIPTNTPRPSPTSTPLMSEAEPLPTATSIAGVAETRVAMMTYAAQTDEAVKAATQAAVDATKAVPTAMAPTGIADEVGIPALLGLSAVLVMVIFLVRRLRTART